VLPDITLFTEIVHLIVEGVDERQEHLAFFQPCVRGWTRGVHLFLGLFAQSPKKVYFTGHISFNLLIHILF
jgi:hypothetical protein